MIEFTFWDILRNLLFATRWTILLSIVAFAGGAAVGLLILFARISKRPWLRRFGAGYIALFQGTPLLMQLFLMFFGLPMLGFRIEPWTAAAFGLTFYASAYLAEIWRGASRRCRAASGTPVPALACTISRNCVSSSCRRPLRSRVRRWSGSWCSSSRARR
ncbi:amino acid ABC transporter permease protein [Sinorhizobium fredii CCBAU 25509]|nr:amino acid ABC transporter permease protein [Sinorhizobium fredii CCBAU 25509]